MDNKSKLCAVTLLYAADRLLNVVWVSGGLDSDTYKKLEEVRSVLQKTAHQIGTECNYWEIVND